MNHQVVNEYFETLGRMPQSAKVTDWSGSEATFSDFSQRLIDWIQSAHEAGNSVLFVGNGGSAAVASHMAIDFSKNGGIRARAFNDAAALTCLANDFSYEEVFSAQIKMHAREGDVLIAISSSGGSKNILNAAAAGRAAGCRVVTLSGFKADNPLRKTGDLNAYVPSSEYGFVEIAHLALIHAVVDLAAGWPSWESAAAKSAADVVEPLHIAHSVGVERMPLPAKPSVLVTGGAGYVGSALIPKLLEAGHSVTVLDLYVYGGHVFGDFHGHENLREIKGDLRDLGVVEDAVNGADAVIHLACISNDPSFELDPNLGKSINFDAFRPLVRASKAAGVKRFVYASSSSVYGIKDEENVTEDLPLEPLTDYSKFKMLCEQVLAEEREDGFVTVTIRPSTVCGYAPRLRLDLTVNILTAHAFHNGAIKVFGGAQKRPNIHIDYITDLYVECLGWDDPVIDGTRWRSGPASGMPQGQISQRGGG